MNGVEVGVGTGFMFALSFKRHVKGFRDFFFWPRRSSQYWNILPATNNDKAGKNILINCFQILNNRQCKALIIERGEAYKVSSHNCPCFLPRGTFLSVVTGRWNPKRAQWSCLAREVESEFWAAKQLDFVGTRQE